MSSSGFSFRECVAADLLRYRAIVSAQQSKSRLEWREWLSLFSPRFLPILLCRSAYKLHTWRLSLLAKMVSLINFVLFGIEIAVRCPIGKGLHIPHSQGIVIGAATIGLNATIYQGVTVGAKELDYDYQNARRPTIGNDVLIGAGAKVLGGITIGSRVKIGANAVVIDNVPDDALVVGPVARIVIRDRRD